MSPSGIAPALYPGNTHPQRRRQSGPISWCAGAWALASRRASCNDSNDERHARMEVVKMRIHPHGPVAASLAHVAVAFGYAPMTAQSGPWPRLLS